MSESVVLDEKHETAVEKKKKVMGISKKKTEAPTITKTHVQAAVNDNQPPPPPTKPAVRDMKLLYSSFGKKNIDAIVAVDQGKTINKSHSSYQVTNQILTQSLECVLNEDRQVECWQSNNGWINVTNFTYKDTDIMNELLYFLINKLNVKPMYKPVPMEKGNDGLMSKYFPIHTKSQFFNKDGHIITYLPMSCFRAKVQMKVMGLQYVSSGDYNAVRLIAYIGSVKVLSEQDMDTLMGDWMLMSN